MTTDSSNTSFTMRSPRAEYARVQPARYRTPSDDLVGAFQPDIDAVSVQRAFSTSRYRALVHDFGVRPPLRRAPRPTVEEVAAFVPEAWMQQNRSRAAPLRPVLGVQEDSLRAVSERHF
jgi:hypothetical protein